MKCGLCDSKRVSVYHKGVRDAADINVLKCNDCGLLFLSKFPGDYNRLYESGGMLERVYDAKTDSYLTIGIDKWRDMTKVDDLRRAADLHDLYKNKDVLEFGCGNGGFLKEISSQCQTVTGVELESNAIKYLNNEGIYTVSKLEKLDKTYDVIFLFHVLEHLTDPVSQLQELKKFLKKDGCVWIETPNADDALITLYECEEFKNFTFWSEHVILYNAITIERLIIKAGFNLEKVDFVQRYPLSNHLYWLSQARPGGHLRWKNMNTIELMDAYADVLKNNGKSDTIVAKIGHKDN